MWRTTSDPLIRPGGSLLSLLLLSLTRWSAPRRSQREKSWTWAAGVPTPLDFNVVSEYMIPLFFPYFVEIEVLLSHLLSTSLAMSWTHTEMVNFYYRSGLCSLQIAIPSPRMGLNVIAFSSIDVVFNSIKSLKMLGKNWSANHLLIDLIGSRTTRFRFRSRVKPRKTKRFSILGWVELGDSFYILLWIEHALSW